MVEASGVVDSQVSASVPDVTTTVESALSRIMASVLGCVLLLECWASAPILVLAACDAGR